MRSSRAKHPTQTLHSLENLVKNAGLLSHDEVALVHRFMADNDSNFGTSVMFLKLVASGTLRGLIEKATGVSCLKVSEVRLQPSAKKLLPGTQAMSLQVFPLSVVDDSGEAILLVATTDPYDRDAIRTVEQATSMKVQANFISLEEIQKLYHQHYGYTLSLFPPENTKTTPATKMNRLHAVTQTSSTGRSSEPNAYVLALVDLLIQKKLITAQEWETALSEHVS